MSAPPCAGKWQLFDSCDPSDHEQAAKLCASCPMLDACRAQLDQARADATHHLPQYGPAGTWAGVLIGSRTVDQRRLATEEAMFTDEDARAAHVAWNRGERDDRARIGERVYQRRFRRDHRARQAVAA